MWDPDPEEKIKIKISDPQHCCLDIFRAGAAN
jgi:hypothetical protein